MLLHPEIALRRILELDPKVRLMTVLQVERIGIAIGLSEFVFLRFTKRALWLALTAVG